MKNIFASKKGLIAILGAAAITVGAVGSYGVNAYFSDNETVTTAPSGGAVAGTFDLLNQSATAKLFENVNLAPGLGEAAAQPVVLKNNGTLKLVTKPTLSFAINSSKFNNVGQLQYSEVKISVVKIAKNGGRTTVGEQDWTSLPSIAALLNNPAGLLSETQRTLEPGEAFEYSVSYRINAQAGNDYQGLKVGATLSVNAFQENDPARN